MASDNEASCESDPNFAVICAFMEKFGTTCGLQSIDFLELQEMLENTQEVPQELIDLHIKLLRKSRKTVSNERWEKAVIKFCHTFCVQDAWEIERFGYKKARLSSKLRVLKELLEMQFDYNTRFKAEINKMSAEELRSQPLGKDKHGHAYWFQNDNNCQIRVYKEDPDEETWTLVAKDREGLAALINELSDGDSKFSSESATNEEDSNSLAEKPIIDTGQVDSSSSDSNIKKISTDSESSNESKESTKKEDNNISQEEAKEEVVDKKEDDVEQVKNGIDQSTKRARESDEDTGEDGKRTKVEEVGEAIEEPLMLVKGQGSGRENECVNPIVGEEIEEDLMFFYGDGNGVDCETGNEDKSGDSKSDQTENCIGQSEARDTSDSGVVSISDSKNCVNNEVPTSPVKSPYKLGTIIDTKTDNKFFSSTVKSTTKTSRWDVETIISNDAGKSEQAKKKAEEKTEDEKETSPKKFFFGPGCLQFSPATVGFGQKVPTEETDKEGDVGYRITNVEEEKKNEEDNKIEYNECVQSGSADAGPLDNEIRHETPLESSVDKLEEEKINLDAAIEETKVEETRINSNIAPVDDEHDIDEKLEDTQTKIEDEVRLEEEADKACDSRQEIPEVTAALVGYKEEKSKNSTEKIETPSNDPEPVPVIEETCVKKQTYVCGEETNKNTVETEQIEEKIVAEKDVKQDINIDENKNEQTSVELESKIVLEEEDKKSDEIEDDNVSESLDVSNENEEQSIASEQEEDTPPPIIKDANTDSKKEDTVSTNEKISLDINKKQDIKQINEDLLKSEDNPSIDETKEVVDDASKADDKKPEMKLEAIVYLKNEDKLKVEEKRSSGEEEVKETTNNAGAKRGRKNNSNKTAEHPVEDDKKSKVFTRRTTRSTKNEEPVEEKAPTEAPARRGRGRASKVEKQEVADSDGTKKMKMSTEEESTRKTRRGKLPETKEEEKVKKDDDVEENKEEKSEIVEEKDEKVEVKEVSESVVVESSNSSDLVEVVEDKDPLAVSGEEDKNKEKPMTLSSFSLDFNESPAPTPPLTRSGLRKRGRESPQNVEETEVTGGKRLKMKAKRAVDVKLRKSIEEQKKKELVSSEDESKSEETTVKKKKDEEAIVVSSDAEKEAAPVRKKKKPMNKNKRLLSNLGIDPKLAILDFDVNQASGIRQSRRIAQLKIKEEAERRKLEEELVHEVHKKKKSKKSEDKDYKAEKKKSKIEDDDDDIADDDSADSKKKRKKKKKKKDKLMFDEFNPWKSSSGSSSSDEEIEEEEEIIEEDDDEELKFVSDHEFSPESDIEGDGEAQPLKRARTARKESDVEEVDDCPCQKCGKSDHPEWILLCDSCDNGWHCSCLRPPLLVIPEGDWFCPPCQHTSLLKNLQEKLNEYDKRLNKKEIEDRRKQRLAYVGISLNNVLPAKDSEIVKKRRHRSKDDEEYDDDDGEDDDEGGDESSEDESESSSSASGSDSDEPIYQLRQRRQAQSYKFNDFDELINSAIQDEMEAVKGAGNQGRGKDISTIVNAEKEEERKKEAEEAPPVELEPLPPVVPLNDKDKEPKPVFGDDDEGVQIKKKIIGRKKHRKLNALDISDEDDEDSDEDFKGTSTESDDDFDEDLGSEDSDDLDTGRNRRRGLDPVRRSTRARTSRYDADFIDDETSDSEDIAPRRKKKRSFWDESESEESDRSWGRRKRKPANRSRKPASATSKKKKSKKKKKHDSDEEVYKKKKPKIKYGLDNDDDGPVRRTRGKKINYIDALGSDSDDDRGKRPPPRIESDEEYVANEDDVPDDEKNSEEEVDPAEKSLHSKQQKIQIQSYTDARFTEVLPEPKNQLTQFLQDELEGELNPIDQINRNVEMMDENEMEKMMEDEEYANKHLQMVAQQLEKEKRRKEREAKKMEMSNLRQPQVPPQQPQIVTSKNARSAKDQFQFSGSMQEPLVGNVDNLIVNSENNDELSEPPGVSLPLFDELGASGDGLEEQLKKRRAKTKKSLEETVASLGTARRQQAAPQVPPPPYMPLGNNVAQQPTDLSAQNSNLEIAAPPQPFSQSQPTPSVITRMLQSKPGQPGYPVGTIRPKQFAVMPERDDEVHHTMASSPVQHGQYIQASGLRPQVSSPYRHMPTANLNHYPRTTPGAPPPIRNPVTSMYHSQHRPLDPSPSGGGAINIPPDHSSPGRVTVSPAASSPGSNKNETPPPPYSRPPPSGAVRFPPNIVSVAGGPRHILQQPQQLVPPPHLQQPPPPRPNMSPYHQNVPPPPPGYHYGQYGGQEDALPPTVYQNSPYAAEQFDSQVNPSENSNSKTFDEESGGGEFGGLVSYFSSQREDDLES